MNKEEAKDFLFDMFNLIGTTAVEYWTEKDAEKMRQAVLTIENESAQSERQIDALSKEIPVPPRQDIKKPRYGMGDTYYDWFCPKCNGFLAFDVEGNKHFGLSRCGRCGQVIDWDKKEDAL